MKQFCSLVGVSKRELAKILSGNLDFKFVSLVKIARLFDVPVTLLFENEENKVQTKFYL